MNDQLYRFERPIRKAELPDVLGEPGLVNKVQIGRGVSLEPIRKEISRLKKGRPSSKWDAALSPVVHGTLKHLPRRVLLDMRFWQALTICEFQEFVWLRWQGEVQDKEGRQLSKSMSGRFLGTESLHGVSRNALARLFWCAEVLASDGGYSLSNSVLENQDFFQAIFERKLGLYAPAARACAKNLAESSEEERRIGLKRVNRYLTTTILEVLDEGRITEIIEEGMQGLQ